ncbi:MAG: putative Ig domain-containing protein [Steroidobacteraceae bacterium]
MAGAQEYSPFERAVQVLTRVRAGEGRCIALFAAHAFLIMASYYVLKALRESFLLAGAAAEVRSYAVAANGLVLMALIPLYSAVRRRIDGARLVRLVGVFFAANILAFAAAYPFRSGRWFGIVFFIWVSVYGLMVVAQFWALAANHFNTKSGQRLFPAIMLGATLGSLVGAQLTDLAITRLGPLPLLLLGAALLGASTALIRPEVAAIPELSRAAPAAPGTGRVHSVFGGFQVVFRSRYLLLVAGFVVLLNCIGSTGDYLLAALIKARAEALAGAQAVLSQREAIIGSLYARYQLWVTLLGVLVQALVVSRVYRAVGVRGALLVLPAIALFVYGAIAFVPVFTMIYVAKILESATNYSLMNTTQQTLYLPTSAAEKFDGKTTIDTFFWRFGDIVQAGVVFVGLNAFGFGTRGFALVNAALCVAWVGVAVLIGRRYTALSRAETHNTAPLRQREPADLLVRPGQHIDHALPAETFFDPDPGDVLAYEARLANGAPLPRWLAFDCAAARLTGIAPEDVAFEERIEIIAIDMDGATASAVFTMRRAVF